jgi:hypothetical protein
MHDSPSMRTAMPMAISSLVFFGKAPSAKAALSICRKAG